MSIVIFRRKESMRKTYFIKTLSFVLSIVFVCSAMVVPAFALSDSDNVLRKNSKGEADDSLGAYLAANTYAEYIAPYADQEYPGCVVTEVPLASGEGVDVIEGLDEWRNYSDNDKDYREGAVFLSKDGEARWTITIPTTGRYYIAFSYYAPKNGTVNSIQRRLFIDGEIPFAEARFLNLSKNWTYNYEPDNSEDGSGFVSDLNGNHITPDVTQAPVWRTYYCSDAEGYRNDYYQFYLEAGEHTIELGAEREDCIMDKIIIEPAGKVGVVSAPTYQEYLDLYAGVPNGSGTVRIETEKPQFVSDSAVYMTSDRSSVVTSPSSPSAQLFNVIGANSYNSIGQWAAYTFTVSEEGMYHFVMRYKQTGLEGMYVCRTIKLSSIDLSTGEREYGLPDGTPTVPFAEAYNTRLNYEDDWQVSVLGDVVNDGNGDVARDFLFHFKPGVEYTLYLEVGLGTLAEQLQRVSNSLDNINAYYLRILQLTGASPDPNRDYHFAEIMPDVVYGLAYEGVQLDSIKKEFERLCGGNTGEHLSTLELVSNLLATMGTDEYEIPAKLSSLKSYLGTLGTWLNQSRNSSVTVDYVDVCFVENKDNLPDPDGNFFQRAWFEITSFFHSFFTEYDQMGITNEADMSDEALDVWLASGRDQSKIWRSMIDSDFSDYCKTESEYCQANGIGNIPVALKLITGGTLLPSILADKGPDVYMGLDSTTTINYAIRGAADPIYGFDADGNQVGFADAMDYLNENFDEAALNTIELLGKYYGVPMTMNFAMMYCRMDILLELDVTPPETWDDLLALLPMLQANNLSAGLGATEGLNTTLEIMMYQAGASMWRYDIDDPELPADITPEEYNRVYAPYAGAKIGLDTTVSLKVFENY